MMQRHSREGTYAVRSAQVRGVEAVPVMVEVSVTKGLPGFSVVGNVDPTVLEARLRVRCALTESGYEIPTGNISVNLAPAELRKAGTGFDLPIAVAILAASGQIPTQDLDCCLFVGELALSGVVCSVRGEVAYAQLAQREGLVLVAGPDVLAGAGTIGSVRMVAALGYLRRGVESLPIRNSEVLARPSTTNAVMTHLDYADVCDQEIAKRAMVIAAAGKHGIMMVGPPGAGKTMLAKRLPTILPPLDEQARIESMLVHSVAGQSVTLVSQGIPPFRAPHHSISAAGLVGGGKPVVPGEISLAHKGVLFLDELPEFANGVLQSLRQPIEDGYISVVRVEGAYQFPCDFMLVAAANPCPCGHLGDPGHVCTCAPAKVESYQARMSGPLADRIDMHIDVARPSSRTVIERGGGMSSREMAEQVREALEFRRWRLAKRGSTKSPLDSFAPEALQGFEGIAHRLLMGGRAIICAARVARTIADVERHEEVRKEDIVEACTYRGRAHG